MHLDARIPDSSGREAKRDETAVVIALPRGFAADRPHRPRVPSVNEEDVRAVIALAAAFAGEHMPGPTPPSSDVKHGLTQLFQSGLQNRNRAAVLSLGGFVGTSPQGRPARKAGATS